MYNSALKNDQGYFVINGIMHELKITIYLYIF